MYVPDKRVTEKDTTNEDKLEFLSPSPKKKQDMKEKRGA